LTLPWLKPRESKKERAFNTVLLIIVQKAVVIYSPLYNPKENIKYDFIFSKKFIFVF
jgi:hypothetical protein